MAYWIGVIRGFDLPEDNRKDLTNWFDKIDDDTEFDLLLNDLGVDQSDTRRRENFSKINYNIAMGFKYGVYYGDIKTALSIITRATNNPTYLLRSEY